MSPLFISCLLLVALAVSAAPPICSGNERPMYLELFDTFGDGWNGYSITFNGESTQTSFEVGPSFTRGKTSSFERCVPIDCFSIVETLGSWPDEVSWKIYFPSSWNAIGDVVQERAPVHDLAVCSACLPGKTTEGPGKCKACERGKFSAEEDSSTCELCPDGKYTEAENTSQCDMCPKGKYRGAQQDPADYNIGDRCDQCARGTFSDTDGATSCSVCSANMYQDMRGGSSCISCLPGKFILSSTSSASEHDAESKCTTCEVGKINSGNECVNCQAGKFRAEGSADCIDCSTGKASSAGAYECEDCTAGKYATKRIGAETCTACAAGKTSESMSDRCDDCENGQYTAYDGDSPCLSCDDGKVSNSDKTECLSCDLGKYKDTTTKLCVQCETGKYRGSQSSVECQNCGPTRYTTDGINCELCPVNTASSGQANAICHPQCNVELDQVFANDEEREENICSCAPGFSTQSASTSEGGKCEQCPVDTYSDVYTKSVNSCTPCSDYVTGSGTNNAIGRSERDSCVCSGGKIVHENACVCPAGTTLDNTDGNCKVCENGKFKAGAGDEECASCPDIKTTEGRVGETTSENCRCPVTFEDSDGTCICPVGYGLDAGRCVACQPGTFSDSRTSDVCSVCPAGTWNQLYLSKTVEDCILCDIGKYSTQVKAVSSSTCIECARGKYLMSNFNSTDHDSPDDCKQCETGHYGEDEGSGSCLPCPSGTFNNRTGQISITSCKKCPAGYIGNGSVTVRATSSTSCEPCGLGTWSNKTGLPHTESCMTCGKGRYNPNEGQKDASACLECIAGKYLEDDGLNPLSHDNRADCIDCPKGEYNEFSGSDKCEQCSPGRYNDKKAMANETACIPCQAGSHGDPRLHGQTSGDDYCKVCNKGEYQPLEGGTEGCKTCKVGTTTLPLISQVLNSSSSDYEMNKAAWHSSPAMCNISSPGFWIVKETGRVDVCPNDEISCMEGNICQIGYEGERCAACSDGFYTSSGGECLACQTSKMAWLPLAVLFALILVLGMVWVMNVKDIQGKTSRHFEEVTPRLWKIAVRVFADKNYRSIMSKGKIAFSYYQVVLLMGQVYSVEYPPTYQAFEANFNWLGLNLMAEIDCFSKVSFLDKLVASTFAPLVCVGFVIIFGYVGMYTSVQEEKRAQRRDKMISSGLLISFIFLPTASFYVFSSFGCNDGLMDADRTISCDDEKRTFILLYSIVMFVIWPVGVPLVYLYVLGKHFGPTREESQQLINRFIRGRVELKEEEQAKEDAKFHALEKSAPKYLNVLNAEFEGRCWWVPVFEQYRKLFITGATILFGSGTVDQLIIGFIVAIMSALVYFAVQPYTDYNDDLFSMVSHLNIVMVLLWSLLVKFNKICETAEVEIAWSIDKDILGWLLILANLSIALVFILFMFVEYQSAKHGIRARSNWDTLERKGVRKNSVVNAMKQRVASTQKDADELGIPLQALQEVRRKSVASSGGGSIGSRVSEESVGGTNLLRMMGTQKGGKQGAGAPPSRGPGRRSSATSAAKRSSTTANNPLHRRSVHDSERDPPPRGPPPRGPPPRGPPPSPKI